MARPMPRPGAGYDRDLAGQMAETIQFASKCFALRDFIHYCRLLMRGWNCVGIVFNDLL